MEAGYDNLTSSQKTWFDELMSSKMSEWPEELFEFVKAGCARYGMCGDVIADYVGQWVKQHSS